MPVSLKSARIALACCSQSSILECMRGWCALLEPAAAASCASGESLLLLLAEISSYQGIPRAAFTETAATMGRIQCDGADIYEAGQ